MSVVAHIRRRKPPAPLALIAAMGLLLLLCLTPRNAEAQFRSDTAVAADSSESPDFELPIDSSRVTLRRPSPALLERLHNDGDLQYDEAARDERSVLEMLFEKLLEWLFTSGAGGFIWDIIKYVLIPALLIYAISKLIGVDFIGLFRRSGARSVEPGGDEFTEDIHEVDFDERIADAIAGGDHRLAVRLLYLKSLRALSERDMIEWTRRKTNHDYMRELSGSSIGNAFARITLVYEHVWYGHFSIDAETFAGLERMFAGFIDSLMVAR